MHQSLNKNKKRNLIISAAGNLSIKDQLDYDDVRYVFWIKLFWSIDEIDFKMLPGNAIISFIWGDPLR